MQDETESIRRARVAELNQVSGDEAKARAELEAQYGEVLDTAQMRERYIVLGFMAPLVVVQHKATGEKGSLEFTGSPRFYFNYQKD